MDMRKIAVIDPCYHKKGGHHHGVNHSLIWDLDWLDSKIYSDSKINFSDVASDYPSSNVVEGFFSDVGYIDSRHYSTIVSFCQQAKAVFYQLKRLQADVVIAHTLIHFHLYGLGLYLSRHQAMTVVLSLMFSPYEGLRVEPTEQIDYCLTSIALRALNDAVLSQGHKVTIGVTSEYHWELMAKLRKDYQFLNFTRSPWLVGAHNRTQKLLDSLKEKQKRTSTKRKKILLYLGDAKPDKGIEDVRDFIKWMLCLPASKLAKAAEHMQLEVHITHCDEWLKPCVHEIHELCQSLPILFTFTNTHFSDKEYFEILVTANIIVWLYDPKKYKYRTSGIFYDAVSLQSAIGINDGETTFIVSQGSWMEREFELLGYSSSLIDLSRRAWMNDLWEKLNVDHSKLVKEPEPNRDLLSIYAGRSWNNWVLAALGLTEERLLEELRQMKQDSRPLIVISTDYPHFTDLSGPTGFVKHLERPLHFKTSLGRSHEYDWIRDLTGLKSATDDALRLERRLISVLKTKPADIICVDGEHSGSLLGLALRDEQLHPDTRIYTWFHQPSSILTSEIIDVALYPAKQIRPICISPCQVGYFHEALEIESEKISVIPHGVHRELISIGQKALLKRADPLAKRGKATHQVTYRWQLASRSRSHLPSRRGMPRA